jgi:aminoglycoside N3'-acetyltransferase/dienelactone hydrolase
LRTLGIANGDLVFCHSSLRSFGHVDGGPSTVVQALLEAVGSGGTLVAPIFRRFFWEGPQQVWDRERSPSLMGAISEAVRTWPGVRRSSHAPHPVAAVGPLAEELTGRRHRTDFALDSPFARLLELDAWVLLLGVDYGICTLIHLLEERLEVPYRHWTELAGTVIEDGVARRQSFPFLARYEGVFNDFAPLGRRLEAEGLVRTTTVGSSLLRAFRARDLHDCGLQALRQDPLFLVSADSRPLAGRYLPDHGEWLTGLGCSPGTIRPVSGPPTAAKLAELLHLRRPEHALEVEVRDRWESPDGLVLEDLHLRGGPSPVIPAILARPVHAATPLPAVICLHGTGGSRERMMEGRFRPQGSHLLGWGRELARRGFAVLAVTQLSHPPRPEPWTWEWPKLLQLYGQTAMGLLVADVACCVDYLSGRPELDPARIGVAGFSLGGIAAFYSHVVEARLAGAAVFCGGVGSLAHLVRAGQDQFHSVYFYPPGLLAAGLDHPSLVPALAPRPLLVAAAEEDEGMPLSGVEAFAAAAREVYPEEGERFRLLVEPGPHAMTPTAFEIAAGWMQAQWGSAVRG